MDIKLRHQSDEYSAPSSRFLHTRVTLLADYGRSDLDRFFCRWVRPLGLMY